MAPSPADRDWSATDDEADSEHFAEYLEQATAFDQVRAYKARSHQLLHLDHGDAVLDAGCGIGDDVIALSEIVGPDGRVVGIDNSEALIEEARSRTADLDNTRFEVGDIYDLEFAADSFAASRADRVLQHLDRPVEALEELKRVTQPAGRIGLTDPDWESLALEVPGNPPAHDILDQEFNVPKNTPIGRQLYRLAREAGLEGIDIDTSLLHSTDFEFVSEMIEFDTWLESMEQAGRIDAAERKGWLQRLEEADDAGLFLVALPAYTVAGTVQE